MTFDPYYTNDHDFLDTLAAAARDRGAVESTALRSRALTLRSLLAHRATGGRMLFQDVVAAVRDGEPLGELDVDWAVGLARVVALQTLDPADMDLALGILRRLPEDRLKARHAGLYATLLWARGKHADARRLLRRRYRRGIPGKAYLEVDLLNPRTDSPYANGRRWSRAFGDLFREHDLEAPHLLDGEGSALDRLHALPRTTVDDGPLVSVVMTTWRPDERLFTSIRSVLHQSWRNLELIVVDDASGPEYDAVLARAAALDPRVTVLRQETNAGTYLARNRAIEVARGEFVTGQDDDDWSHPRRLERQVRPLLEQPHEVSATLAYTLMATPDLVLNRVGQPILGKLAPSYMTRTSVMREAGGFLDARKGADTELLRRVEAMTGQKVLELRQPLGVYRITPGSLSRAEFGPGWHHPVRAQFWSSAARAHARIAAGAPPHEVRDKVVVPRRYSTTRLPPAEYDVAFAADWRDYGSAHHPLLDEVLAVVRTGRRVALIHLPDHRRPERRRFEIHPVVQDLVNDRVVDRVLVDDDATIRTVLVMQPGVLQLPSEGPTHLTVERVLVVANQGPDRRRNRRVAYVVPECHRHARRLFGVDPVWVARTRPIRDLVAPALRPEHVSDQVLPSAVDVTAWSTAVRPPVTRTPVVGHHARAGWDWPETRTGLAAAYPTDGSLEVRVLGSAGPALSRLGLARTPPGWVVYGEHETTPRTYLNQLDFYVHLAGPLGGEDSLLSAAFAAGKVVVLAPTMEAQYGDAAVYARPEEVRSLVRALHGDPAAYVATGRRAQDHARAALSTESYLETLRRLGVLAD